MHRSRLASRVAAITGLFLALGLAPASSQAAAKAGDGVKVAVADFSYVDTSGEPADQVAVHRRRLQTFMTALKADLGNDSAFRLLSCAPSCADDGRTPADLLHAAATAGAKILVTGGIQKLSTLIQWAKVTAFDVDTSRVVFDKLFTFRGDSDEAWQRAEVFISQETRAALTADRQVRGEANQNGDRHD